MNAKVNEGKWISGKEALIALANGEEVQCANAGILNWNDVIGDCHIGLFTTGKNRNGFDFVFRLKPRTITINGIEVPAPFEPKVGDVVWCISDDHGSGYCSYDWLEDHSVVIGAWRTEEEIKQVVAALRQAFGGSHDN